jgi:hypothetical protein
MSRLDPDHGVIDRETGGLVVNYQQIVIFDLKLLQALIKICHNSKSTNLTTS